MSTAVVKDLKIKDSGHHFTNQRMCDRKLSLTLNWIHARFKSLKGTKRIGTDKCLIRVQFYFDNPAEATWFDLMFKQEMIEV